MNAWIILSFSIAAEVSGNILLKTSQGLSKFMPTVGMALCYIAAIWLMGIVTKQLEIGITYAIWAGAGTALTAVLGILFFSENVSPIKILGVGCIVVGVGLLNLSQPAA